MKEVWYLREFRGGVLVGRDALGNCYYEMREGNSSTPFDDDLPFCKSRLNEYPSWGNCLVFRQEAICDYR